MTYEQFNISGCAPDALSTSNTPRSRISIAFKGGSIKEMLVVQFCVSTGTEIGYQRINMYN